MRPRLHFLIRLTVAFLVGGLVTACAADVDWGKAIFDSVNNLVDVDGALFVQTGLGMVAASAFCKLMWGLATDSLHRLGAISSAHTHFDLESILKTLFQAFVLTQVLVHWSVPLAGMTHSIHQIPMYISDQLVTGLAASKADQLMTHVKSVAVNMQHPNPLAIMDVFIYLFILFDMGILALVTFLLTSFSYIGEAVFVVLTPLFLWCTFFHTLFSWCWNCVQNMFSFAAYKVVGAIIIYILSDVMVNFFVNGVGTDYTVGHWITLLPVVIMFSGLFIFSLFLVPLLCASIFNGAGAIGQAVTLAATKAI